MCMAMFARAHTLSCIQAHRPALTHTHTHRRSAALRRTIVDGCSQHLHRRADRNADADGHADADYAAADGNAEQSRRYHPWP